MVRSNPRAYNCVPAVDRNKWLIRLIGCTGLTSTCGRCRYRSAWGCMVLGLPGGARIIMCTSSHRTSLRLPVISVTNVIARCAVIRCAYHVCPGEGLCVYLVSWFLDLR